ICAQDPRLTGRLNIEIASQRLCNLISAWSHEIAEMLGGMGISSLESLRGNRDRLRGVGLSEWELDALGIKGAGE
ncbi:MAG: glutamate synthase-related protein, partial [Methanothrix sp.]|nr:glutamate synthase-related protein [Methanothrix sp.]